MEDKLRRKDGGSGRHGHVSQQHSTIWERCWERQRHVGRGDREGRSQMYSHERSRVASAHRRLPWSAGIKGI
jgi:hypothetical protein